MSYPYDRTLRDELHAEYRSLDNACRARLGISAIMFRTAKFVFYISTLVFTGYLIEIVGVPWTVAVGVAVLFVTGPEGIEAYLVRQDIIDEAEDPDQP